MKKGHKRDGGFPVIEGPEMVEENEVAMKEEKEVAVKEDDLSWVLKFS